MDDFGTPCIRWSLYSKLSVPKPYVYPVLYTLTKSGSIIFILSSLGIITLAFSIIIFSFPLHCMCRGDSLGFSGVWKTELHSLTILFSILQPSIPWHQLMTIHVPPNWWIHRSLWQMAEWFLPHHLSLPTFSIPFIFLKWENGDVFIAKVLSFFAAWMGFSKFIFRDKACTM